MGLCFTRCRSRDIPISSSSDSPPPHYQQTSNKTPSSKPNPYASAYNKPGNSFGKTPSSSQTQIGPILGRPYVDINTLYTLEKELGRGQFGVTHLCTEKATGKRYACKSISRRKLSTSKDIDDVRREIMILQHLTGQPNIVEFKGAYEDRQNLHLIMELCSGGELFDRITAKGSYSERQAAQIFRQIVNVVHVCHFMGVMHRDLKPENFLLVSKDENAPLKAIDFGLSVFIEQGKVYRDVVGSAYYVAPEVLVPLKTLAFQRLLLLYSPVLLLSSLIRSFISQLRNPSPLTQPQTPSLHPLNRTNPTLNISMLRNHPYLPEDLQEALEHLASIDLIDLCNEAKVERCRATRDLRSCGRYVMDVLNSCGHASLCAECSQRCDVCPICRIPIPKNGKKLRRRLYDQCSEARLISKKCDKRFQEKEDGEEHISVDVQRLYSLFDVALENNLVSLICHYVTDVCLDESAVSSDPVIAFLLDEVVVKDWCKRTFQNIIIELQGIYNLETEQMKSTLSALLKFSAQLAGISNVLDVLDSSFKGSLSAQLQDLHQLQETILKTTQHMEAMIWCLRHEFLENVRPCNANFTLWHSLVRERKSAAIKRSWPDAVNNSEASTGQEGTLFIEDALVNLEIERGNTVKLVEELKLASLQKDGVSSIFRSEIEGVAGCYPFENVRAAVDILFLCGSSDLVVAKQAIFLYYLFDRHWTMPDEQWRHIVEDFGATFGIPRHLLLESLIFYLLDDHTDEALQEACHLLPEISGPATHPKIAQVLLERGNPDTALSVLRWSGRDGTSKPISLSEAVTAVRVRVECGLFTEAFIHQRMLCTKVKEKKLKCGQFGDVTDDSTCKYKSWEDWVEILVTEICVLCIRRNMVDRMIELPWNSDEEKHLHKCLLDYTIDDPSSIIGSLLVIFYIQRYRYSEAYHVDQILKNAEQEFISKNSVSEEVLSRMRSMSGRRTGLIDKCMELLPEVQRQQVKAGKFPEISGATSSEVEMSATCPLPEVQVSKSTSLLIPSSVDFSHALWTDCLNPSWKPSISETPKKRVALVDGYRSDLGNHGSSVLHERLFTNSEMQWKPDNSINKSFNFEDASTPEIHWATPLSAVKGGNRSSFKLLSNSHLQDNQYDKMSPETEKNRSFNPFRNTSPLHYYSANSNPVTTPSSNHGQFKDSAMNLHRVSSKAYYPDRDDRPWDMVSKDDSMDISLNYGEKSFGIEDRNLNHGPRWRSDETSDEEEEQSPQKATDITHHTPTSTTRGVRRSRFSKR